MEKLTYKDRLSNGMTLSVTLAVITAIAFALTKTESLFGVFGTYVLTIALIYTIGSISVNMISGYCGQLSLGQAGFFAIGAYTAGLLGKYLIEQGMPMIPVLIIGIIAAGVVAGLFGFLIGIPTLRLSGDYLAIVTLGFAEIIRNLIINTENITGGARGISMLPKFSIDRYESEFQTFMWVFAIFVIIAILVMNVVNSASGRRIVSVREDEIAANAMGIDIKRNKYVAFIMASAIAGVGGALFAFNQGSLDPGVFVFQMSIDFLIIAVFGGLGSFSGTIIAGVLLTVLNQGVLPSLDGMEVGSFTITGIEQWRLVIYAIALILVMVFRPIGIMGTKEIRLVKFVNNLFESEKKETKEETTDEKNIKETDDKKEAV